MLRLKKNVLAFAIYLAVAEFLVWATRGQTMLVNFVIA